MALNLPLPPHLSARFGTDATRFTLARGATPGTDEAISEETLRNSLDAQPVE